MTENYKGITDDTLLIITSLQRQDTICNIKTGEVYYLYYVTGIINGCGNNVVFVCPVDDLQFDVPWYLQVDKEYREYINVMTGRPAFIGYPCIIRGG